MTFSYRNSRVYKLLAKAHGLIRIPEESQLEYAQYKETLNIPAHTDDSTQRVVFILDRGEKGAFFVEETFPLNEEIEFTQDFDHMASRWLTVFSGPPKEGDPDINLNTIIDVLQTVGKARAVEVFQIYDTLEAYPSIPHGNIDPLFWGVNRVLYGNFKELAIVVTPPADESIDPGQNSKAKLINLV